MYTSSVINVWSLNNIVTFDLVFVWSFILLITFDWEFVWSFWKSIFWGWGLVWSREGLLVCVGVVVECLGVLFSGWVDLDNGNDRRLRVLVLVKWGAECDSRREVGSRWGVQLKCTLYVVKVYFVCRNSGLYTQCTNVTVGLVQMQESVQLTNSYIVP
jgi:hypothetical protein